MARSRRNNGRNVQLTCLASLSHRSASLSSSLQSAHRFCSHAAIGWVRGQIVGFPISGFLWKLCALRVSLVDERGRGGRRLKEHCGNEEVAPPYQSTIFLRFIFGAGPQELFRYRERDVHHWGDPLSATAPAHITLPEILTFWISFQGSEALRSGCPVYSIFRGFVEIMCI